MRRALLPLCLLAIASVSCATNGNVPSSVQVIDTACVWTKPILIGRDDRLTDATARQILAHNKAQAVACPSTTPSR